MDKIEFIESYIKVPGGDYQWNDNHGLLVRCYNCKHVNECEIAYDKGRNGEFFCANGEVQEDKNDP